MTEIQHNPGFLKAVAEAKARIRETDVHAVHARMAAGETIRFLDVREDCEWERGHIPGATHVGRGVIERDIETVLPDRETEIYVYCGGGFRSALATDALQRMGYTGVVSMDGGARGWSEAGYPMNGEYWHP